MHSKIRNVLTNPYFLSSLGCVLVYALIGFVAIPLAIRWYLPTFAEQTLHCRASVDTVRLNPFVLTLEMQGLRIQQADGEPVASLGRFFVDLETSSVFRLALILRAVELEQPDIHLVIASDGLSNVERLLPPSAPAQQPAAEPSPLFPFVLEQASINGGQLLVIDQRQSVPAQLALKDITLQVNALSSLKDQEGRYQATIGVEEGTSFQAGGAITLSPLRTTGKADLKNLSLAAIWQFLRDNTNLEQPSGHFDIATSYTIDQGGTSNQMALTDTTFSLGDLSLRQHKTETDLIALKKWSIDIPKIDLAAREVQIKNLSLEQGAVNLRINEAGSLNMQQLLREPSAKPPSQTGNAKTAAPTAAPPQPDVPFKVAIDAVDLKAIAVTLDDLSRKAPMKAAIAGLNLHLQSHMALGAGKPDVVVQDIAMELKGTHLQNSPTGPPLFAADQITLEKGGVDLAKQMLNIDRIALTKGRLDAGRDAQGNLNWQQMLEPKNQQPANVKVAPPAAGPVWKFLVKTFEANDFTSQFSDQTTAAKKPVLSLKNIAARCTNIDGISPMDFSVALQNEQGGTAAIKGKVNPAKPSVDASVQTSNLDLTFVQPYIEPQAYLILQSATVTTQGRLQHGIAEKKFQTGYEGSFNLNDLRLVHPNAAKKPYLSWKALQIPQLRLSLEPNRFDAQDIVFVKPTGELIIEEDGSLNVTKVLKEQPATQKSVKPAKPESKKTAGKKEQQDFPYQIARIRVDDANMVFADLKNRPRFMTRIHSLKGTVTGLSSAPDTQAKILMEGMVDQYGTAKISGQVYTSDFPRASNIEMDFRNLEMKNLSPYSGRFAGRLIKSGKVSANLKYILQNYKMTGDNKIIIDKLTLGEKVNSPESANLPLDLAIALLQDANGRIDVGLPVSGDLNDPEFSFGGLIWKVFTNLITKAATSPFRAIGSLLGTGEDNFDAVVFDQGKADLLPPEKEKLLKLTEALNSRPQLKLVLQGRYNTESDGNELKQRAVRTQVARKRGIKPDPSELNQPLDFDNSNTRDALEQLYVERFGKKALEELEQGVAAGTITPRLPVDPQTTQKKDAGFLSRMTDSMNLYKLIPGGMSREQSALWSGELFTRLTESEKIADTTLLQLAENRAQAVAGHLRNEARISTDRLEIKTAEPLPEGDPPSTTLSLEAL